MPLPLGKWTVNVNGTQGELIFTSLTPDGLIEGALVGGQTIRGLWDESSQILSFVSENVGGVDQFSAYYTGYLFSTPASPEPGRDINWTLSGYLMVLPQFSSNFAKATSRRNVFGWFAQISQIV